MMGKYTHSNTFGNLKGIEEGIAVNLTSFQYLSTLSLLLRHGLDIIYSSAPSFIENFAAKATATQTLKPATKFSMNPRGSLPKHLFNFLVTKDQSHFYDMNLNRGILFGILAVFGSIVNTYDKIHALELEVHPTTESSLGCMLKDAVGMDYRYNLFAVSREVRYWEAKAHWFKSLIVQKYVRMALLQAQSTYKELSHSLSLDDISQIYLSFVSKAIDRCDTRQGVLTTFITSWLKSAKADAANQAKENYHSSYEELIEEGVHLGEVLPNRDYEAIEHLIVTAKKLDKEGYIRAPSHIPENVTKKQLAILQLFVENKL